MSRISISLSGEEKTIKEIWKWYEIQNKSLLSEKYNVKHSLDELTDPNKVSSSYAYFYGMHEDEFNDFFRELDYLTMLDLLASGEAALKIDFYCRLSNRKPKDNILTEYRRIYNVKKEKVSLENDILDVLSNHLDELKSEISDFKGCMKLRHWLAHGRYWTPKLPRPYTQYEAQDVYDIVFYLLDGMRILN